MNTLPVRQLAIRLACIQPADRAWVMDRLHPHEREQMNILLMEVTALGLDKDLAVLTVIANEPLIRFPKQGSGTAHEQPFWRALSEQTEPQALVAALVSHLAVSEIAHVES